MCKILPRIKLLADNEGITIGALERSIGASKGVISRAITNGTDIQSKWLQLIVEKYPHYSAQWLLSGVGEMLHQTTLSTSKDEQSKNKASTTLLSENKPKRRSSIFEQVLNPSQSIEAIPLVSVKAVGGFAGEDFAIKEQDVDGYYVIPKFRNLNVDFLIEISGDSMMPRFYPGDIIACSIVHNSRFIQWNKPYLIATREDGMIVKRIKPSTEPDSILAVSDNAEYDPFDIPKSDIDGLARVVGVIHAE